MEGADAWPTVGALVVFDEEVADIIAADLLLGSEGEGVDAPAPHFIAKRRAAHDEGRRHELHG